MSTVATGTYELDVDLKKFEAGLESASKKAGKAAQDSGKKMESSWAAAAKSLNQNQMVSQLETISALGIQAGGNVSRLASVVTSLIRPVALATSVLGPMALAIGGIAVGTGAAALALKAYVTASVETGKEAGEAGQRLLKLGLLTEAETEFVKRMTDATRAAEIAQDRLTVSSARAAPQVGVLTEAYTGLKIVLADAASAFGEMKGGLGDTLTSVQRSIPVIGGLLEKMTELAGPTGSNVGVIPGVNWALDTLVQRARAAAPAVGHLKEETKAAADANNEWLRGLLANVDAQLGLYDRARLLLQPLAEQKSAVEGLIEVDAEAARQRAEVMDQFMAEEALKSETLAAALQLRRENRALELEEEEAYWAGIREMYLENNEIELEAARDLNDEVQRIHDDRVADQAASDRSYAQLQGQLALQMASYLTQIGQTVSEAVYERYAEQATAAREYADYVMTLEDELSASEFRALSDSAQRQKEDARKRADLAYGLSKSLAATQAIIQSIVMGSGIAANIAPFTGPAAPAIAGAIAAAFLGTQLAGIATAPAPEYPTGMTPDHYPVGIQAGEGIANRVAMADPDMRDMLRDANAARPTTQRSDQQQVDVRVSLDSRTSRLRVATTSGMPGKTRRRR